MADYRTKKTCQIQDGGSHQHLLGYSKEPETTTEASQVDTEDESQYAVFPEQSKKNSSYEKMVSWNWKERWLNQVKMRQEEQN